MRIKHPLKIDKKYTAVRRSRWEKRCNLWDIYAFKLNCFRAFEAGIPAAIPASNARKIRRDCCSVLNGSYDHQARPGLTERVTGAPAERGGRPSLSPRIKQVPHIPAIQGRIPALSRRHRDKSIRPVTLSAPEFMLWCVYNLFIIFQHFFFNRTCYIRKKYRIYICLAIIHTPSCFICS